MKFRSLLLSSFTELPVMQIPLVCFLTLCSLFLSQTLTATPTPIPGSDASTLTAHMAGFINSTLDIPPLPEEFTLTYEIGGPKLRVTSCLMNAVAALKELALGDWDRKIRDGTEYRLDDYPEVSIIVTTSKRKRNILASFVTWAVCLGMLDMISQTKFEFAQFEMSWEGQRLGWVQVVNHSPRTSLTVEERQTNGSLDLGTEPATLPTTNQPVNITDVITTDNANDPAEARLNVIFEPYGSSISLYDVFVPIMSGLSDMGRIPSTSQSTGLMIGLRGFTGFICFIAAIPPRTSPPFLEFGWLVRSVARIPAYMLREGRFGEITIKITVDGAAVGFGRLSKAPDCNDDGSLASLGVAES